MKKLHAIFLALLVSGSGQAFALEGEGYSDLTMHIKVKGCKSFKVNPQKLGDTFRRYMQWNDDGTWNYVDQVMDIRTDILFAEMGEDYNLGGTYSMKGANTMMLYPDAETRNYYAALVASFADEVCYTDYTDGDSTIAYTKNSVVVNKRGTVAKLSSSGVIYTDGYKIGTLKETAKFNVVPGSFPTVSCSYSYYYGYSCY